MNQTNYPIWFQQINYQKRKKMILYGLTIPYIIGTYKLLGESATEKNLLKHLFEDILNSNLPQCAVIQKCPHIKQYVIGIESKEFCAKFFKNEISFKNKDNVDVLYITQNAKELGNNFDIIINKLRTLYKDKLASNLHTWDNDDKKWRVFNKNEIDLILSAIEK